MKNEYHFLYTEIFPAIDRLLLTMRMTRSYPDPGDLSTSALKNAQAIAEEMNAEIESEFDAVYERIKENIIEYLDACYRKNKDLSVHLLDTLSLVRTDSRISECNNRVDMFPISQGIFDLNKSVNSMTKKFLDAMKKK